jgi:glycosyltransferase involved in cell wall biosynthesis
VTPWVHFTGTLPDPRQHGARADVVWVPSLADRGRGSVLEAMAVGRPVVAARWPRLVEVVAEGATGLLAPPGNKAALARLTRELLEDAGKCRRMGEEARRRAAKAFNPAGLVAACAAVYDK